MLATFELEAVRRFAADFNARLDGCNGEGTFCSELDEKIRCTAQLCQELVQNIYGWSREVFAGRVAFDQAVEDLWKGEAEATLKRAKSLAVYGWHLEGKCLELEALPSLNAWSRVLSGLLDNWVSPRRSVGPAARVTISPEVEAKMRERLAQLKPLPKDWLPSDASQAEALKRHRTR